MIDVGDAQLLAQHAIEMGEEALRAFLAVRDEANGLAGQRGQARRRLTQRRGRLVGRIEDLKVHGAQFHIASVGSQSTQAPIGSVTARLLWPSQGGMTAPNPPAGPPAATTSS